MPDKPRRATALQYDPESSGTAPKVTATGRGLVADRIVEEAEKAGVPVRRDEALAAGLAGLELGEGRLQPVVWRLCRPRPSVGPPLLLRGRDPLACRLVGRELGVVLGDSRPHLADQLVAIE